MVRTWAFFFKFDFKTSQISFFNLANSSVKRPKGKVKVMVLIKNLLKAHKNLRITRGLLLLHADWPRRLTRGYGGLLASAHAMVASSWPPTPAPPCCSASRLSFFLFCCWWWSSWVGLASGCFLLPCCWVSAHTHLVAATPARVLPTLRFLQQPHTETTTYSSFTVQNNITSVLHSYH